MRDVSLQIHNQLLDLSNRMQKQSLSAIAQVGNVAKGVAKGYAVRSLTYLLSHTTLFLMLSID
jgi:hypothetical protein